MTEQQSQEEQKQEPGINVRFCLTISGLSIAFQEIARFDGKITMRHLALVTFPTEGTGVHFKRLPYVSEATETCLYESALMVDLPIPREFLPYYLRFCEENTRLSTIASG